MKKIMFSDEFMLTQAVLEGRKTQTRRIIKGVYSISCGGVTTNICHKPKYKIGEVVAVAQSYKDAGIEDVTDRDGFSYHTFTIAAYDNKMFTRADLMPHQIRITNIRTERLQDISEEDCLKEGIGKYYLGIGTDNVDYMGFTYSFDGKHGFPNAREAYANLIDLIFGKGIWENNPYVFVYDFELVK